MVCAVEVVTLANAAQVTSTPAMVETQAQSLMTTHRAASVAAETTLGLSAGGVQGTAGIAHTTPSPLSTTRNDGVQTWQMHVGDLSTLGSIHGMYQRIWPYSLSIHLGDIVTFTKYDATAPAAFASAFPAQNWLVLNGSSTDATLNWPQDNTIYTATNPTSSFADAELASGLYSEFATTYAPARAGTSWYMGHGVMASGEMSAAAATASTLGRAWSVQFALPGTYPVWSVTHQGDVRFSAVITVLSSCAPRQLPLSTGLIREYPTLSGMNNNLRYCVLGMTNFKQSRLANQTFYGTASLANPTAVPSSTSIRTLSVTGTPLPTGRNISNTMLSKQQQLNQRAVSDLHTSFAMFLTFDISALGAAGGPIVPQPIPACDLYLDACPVGGTGGSVSLSFSRMVPLAGTGTDQQANPTNYPNGLTSFLDLSSIYGIGTSATEQPLPSGGISVQNDVQTAHSIREFVGGRLCLECNTPGGSVVPNNVGHWLPAGDSRINKSPSVYAIAVVWRREHNRLAAEYALANPTWSDEQIFQEARRMVTAFWQKIITREYLATEVGQPLPPYTGYKDTQDPSTLLEFSAGAGRYGHAMITPQLWRRDHYGAQIAAGDINWGTCLFRTEQVSSSTSPGIEPVLWGMIAQRQAAVGPRLTDAVRNMVLFGAKRGFIPSGDLSVTNIARGKDIGLPTYNDMRQILGLPRRTSFSEISSVADVVSDLATLYASVDDVDLFIGGISEDPRLGGNLGQTFGTIALEQTRRWRDGDRFWYENPDYFSTNETQLVYETTWSLILARNTNMTIVSEDLLPKNSFFTLGSDLAYLARTALPLALSTDARYAHSVRPHPSYVLSWSVLASGYVDIELRVGNAGWVGLGLEPIFAGTMKGADIVICRFLPAGVPVTGVRETGSTGLDFECIDSWARDVGAPTPDTAGGGTDDLISKDAFVEMDYSSSSTGRQVQVFRFQKPLVSADQTATIQKDKPFDPVLSNIIYAFHPDSQAAVYHGPSRATAKLNWFPSATSAQLSHEKDSEPLQLALLIISAVLLLLPLLTLVLVYLHRDHARIRAATLFFCVLIPLGVLCAFVGVIIAMLPKTVESCMAFYWLVGSGFIAVFGSCFVKTARIVRIFQVNSLGGKGKQSGKLQSVKITTTALAFGVLAMAACMWVILAVWSAVDPLTPTYQLQSGSATVMHEHCANKSDGFLIAWLAFPMLVLLAGSWMAYSVRGVDNAAFNESSSLGQSIYVSCVLAIIAILFGWSLRTFPNTTPLIQAIGVWGTFTFALVSQFAGKFSAIAGEQGSKVHTMAGRSHLGHTTAGGAGAVQSHMPDEAAVLQKPGAAAATHTHTGHHLAPSSAQASGKPGSRNYAPGHVGSPSLHDQNRALDPGSARGSKANSGTSFSRDVASPTANGMTAVVKLHLDGQTTGNPAAVAPAPHGHAVQPSVSEDPRSTSRRSRLDGTLAADASQRASAAVVSAGTLPGEVVH